MGKGSFEKKFNVLKYLGGGAYGQVYKAEEKSSKEQVSLLHDICFFFSQLVFGKS